MFLKFQEMRKVSKDSWAVNGDYHVVECSAYSVQKEERRVFATRDGGSAVEEVVPNDIHQVMYVMNGRGETVDSVVFPVVN